MGTVRTKDLLDILTMKVVAGETGMHREVISNDISRPAFEMTGYFEYYPKERIQIVGKTEMNYFLNLTEHEQMDRMKGICTDVTPGIIVSNDMEVPQVIID